MKRRINLIAGLLHSPKLLILDEPMVGIDVQSKNVIRKFLQKLNTEGTTIIYTSHIMEDVQKLCNQIGIIDKGKLITTSSPNQLLDFHKDCNNLEDVFPQAYRGKIKRLKIFFIGNYRYFLIRILFEFVISLTKHKPMKKIFFSIYKESLILIRDIQGVMLLFFMPMILVVVVALLQHKTFQNLSETSISVIIVDNDGGEVGESLREGIKNQNIFKVTELIGDSAHFEENAKKQVAEGDFQIGIIIPKGATKAIKRRALLLVKTTSPIY